MHFAKFKGFLSALLTCYIFQIQILQAECSVGVVFSVSVDKTDLAGPNTKQYDIIYMSTLLEQLTYRNIRQIGTYGVGAQKEAYVANVTWSKAASIVNTSIAAALINQKENKKVLSVYQGVYVSDQEFQLDAEINLAFEVASKANSIYNGTVEALLFPSITGIDFLFPKGQKVISTAQQCKHNGLKLGVRIWDCHQIQAMDKNDPKLLLLVLHYNFIICQFVPNEAIFQGGPENFLKTITKIVEAVADKTRSMEEGRGIEVMLESGWPAEENDERGAGQMSKFWNGMKNWTEESNMQIFLQEAFDNPWKNAIRQVYKGGSYGLMFKESSGKFTSKFDFKLESSTNHHTTTQPQPPKNGKGGKGGCSSVTFGGTPLTFLYIVIFKLLI